ncbi:hypothetical protein HYT05_01450 [Candidatus Kaiserbacteria bacterium]|nr:hypothetical protein [Candidatus Kaiserbacteria bacterium]
MHDHSMIVSLRPKPEPAAPAPAPAPVPAPTPEPVKKKPSRNILTLLAPLIILAVLGYGTYYFWPFGGGSDAADAAAQSEQAAQAAAEMETKETVDAVGKLIALPEGEQPTVATVSDPAKLKDQAFFAKAQMGDKVLIYTKAKKAYLYRPSKDLLIEVAPITTDIQ